MKRPTDKERMNWCSVYENALLICNWGQGNVQLRDQPHAEAYGKRYTTIRQAVDAAMKIQKKRKVSEK